MLTKVFLWFYAPNELKLDYPRNEWAGLTNINTCEICDHVDELFHDSEHKKLTSKHHFDIMCIDPTSILRWINAQDANMMSFWYWFSSLNPTVFKLIVPTWSDIWGILLNAVLILMCYMGWWISLCNTEVQGSIHVLSLCHSRVNSR